MSESDVKVSGSARGVPSAREVHADKNIRATSVPRPSIRRQLLVTDQMPGGRHGHTTPGTWMSQPLQSQPLPKHYGRSSHHRKVRNVQKDVKQYGRSSHLFKVVTGRL